MSKKYILKRQKNPKAEGYVRLIVGILLAICAIITVLGLVYSQTKKPNDLEYVKGKVSKVVSVAEHSQLKKGTGSKFKTKIKVYDCNIVIEYAVNGQMYETNYLAKDRENVIKEGNALYVGVSTSNPSKVYSISETKNSFINSGAAYYIGAGILVVVSIILIVTGIKTIKVSRKNIIHGIKGRKKK